MQFLLFIGLMIMAAAPASEAQSLDLEKIVVTNRRAQIDESDASENIAGMTSTGIQGLPARDLSEALSYLPGVDIEPRQGFGRATGLSIQGSSSRQVKVMVDGIPFNSQSSGQINPAIFPINDIKRIEVIKGPASSAWGSSLGGVINVITKDTGNTKIPKGSLTTSFAEFKTRKESLELSGKAADLGYYLLSDYMESHGKGAKSEVSEKKSFGKVSWDLGEAGKIISSFGYSAADVNSGRFPDGTWQAQPYRSRYGKVGWEASLAGTDIKVEGKHSRQEIITKNFNSLEDIVPRRRIESRDMLYQLSLNSATHLREKDLLVLGADFDWDKVKSTYLFKARSLTLQAPYSNYTLKQGPWDLNLGMRYDFNSEFKGQLSPAFGTVYKFKDVAHTLIRLQISRAFNAPPLLWKYYERSLSGVATNPDIKPERAWVYETGLEMNPVKRLWTKLSAYRSDVSDAIASARNSANQIYMKNYQKFRRQGAELQFKWDICGGLSFYSAAAFNDVENRQTRKTVRGGGSARQRFDLGLEYKTKFGFGLFLKGYYNRWNESAAAEPNDRKMLCDVKFTQEFKNLALFLDIHNLNNSKYWADYFYPVPQRYFEGGVTFKW